MKIEKIKRILRKNEGTILISFFLFTALVFYGSWVMKYNERCEKFCDSINLKWIKELSTEQCGCYNSLKEIKYFKLQ